MALGYSSQVVQITGVGSTPEGAVQSARLVGTALTRELDRVQASQGVDPHYKIKAQQVVAPDSPKRQISSTLRPLVGVLAVGAILLLLAVSAADALEAVRAERGRPKKDARGDPIGGSVTSNGSVHHGEDLLEEDGTVAAIAGAANNNSGHKPQRSRRKAGSKGRRRKTGGRA